MTDTPKTGETVTSGDSQTTVTTTATTPPATTTPPVVNAADTAEVERLRKEVEQARMRSNQLEKEKAARDTADEEARQKKLEEENNYKELLEQERAKREALEADAEARATTEALNKAKAEALSGYSEEVKTLAEEVGLNLTAVDETAVEEFKGKLTKLSERVSSEARVGANNPNQPGGKVEFTAEQLRNGALEDGKAFHDLVTAKYPGIAAMTSKPK